MSASPEDVLKLLDERQQQLEAPAKPAPAAPGATGGGQSPEDVLKLLDEHQANLAASGAPEASTETPTLRAKADKTPLPTPADREVATGSSLFGLESGIDQPAFQEMQVPDVVRKAAESGVLYDKPAPAGHALASLAIDDKERENAYRISLQRKYGKDVQVEIGPQTKAIEYYDPDSNRFALADPPDRSLLENVSGATGTTIVAIPELAGGALAAFSTKSPTMAALGGGGGAFVGEATRIFIGKRLGINQDVTPERVAWEATKTGLISAGSGIAIDRLVAVAKYIEHAVAGDAVSFAKNHAQTLGTSVEDAAKLQEQINDALGAERLRLGIPANEKLPGEAAPKSGAREETWLGDGKATLNRDFGKWKKGDVVDFSQADADKVVIGGVSYDAKQFQGASTILETSATAPKKFGTETITPPEGGTKITPPGQGEQVQFTLGEASGDPDLLMWQDALKRNASYQARFGEFDAERQSAFRNFFDLISKPFKKSPIDATRTAEGVQCAGQTRLNYDQRRATEDLARYQADADEALSSIETKPMSQLGDVARTVGDAEYGAFQGRAETLASNIRSMAGSAKFIQNTHLADVFNKLDKQAKNVFITALRRDTRKSQMLPPKTVETPEGEAALNPLYDPETKHSFGQAWDTLSRLKQVIRDGGMSDRDLGALKQMAGALESDMYESAADSELGGMYRAFTTWYRREKTRLNQGTVGKILQRTGPGGPFTMADETVFSQVFPTVSPQGGGGLTPTREFMDLIKNDPQAVQGFRQAILDDWQKSVVRDGVVDPQRHKAWLDMHRAQLELKFPGLAPEEKSALGRFGLSRPENAGEPLFTAQELRSINRAAGAATTLKFRQQAYDETLKKLNTTFNAQLANLDDAGQILTLVKSDLDGKTAGKLVGLLQNPGTLDVLRGVRAEYLKDMKEKILTSRISTTQDTIVNGKALSNFLYGRTGEPGAERGQIQVIRQLFGDDYADGLSTLEQAMKYTRRETSQPNRSNTSGWWQVGKALVRWKFGVISKASRTITSAQMAHQAMSERAISKALMNPADMKRLMQIWHSDLRDRKAAVVLGNFGLNVKQMIEDATQE